MKLITSLEQLNNAQLLPSAAALGTFDGVHRGHQEVILNTKEYAREHHLQLMVFTFSTHPLASLTPELEPARLLDNETKIHLMVELGVDVLVNIPFTRELAARGEGRGHRGQLQLRGRRQGQCASAESGAYKIRPHHPVPAPFESGRIRGEQYEYPQGHQGRADGAGPGNAGSAL